MNKQHVLLTPNEVETLGRLMSWAIEGPSQGIQNVVQWKAGLKELVQFCKDHGILIYGQWTDL